MFPASILYESIAGRYRPVSYPDGPISARYRFIKNAYWVIHVEFKLVSLFAVMDASKLKDRMVYFINPGVKGLNLRGPDTFDSFR